MAFRFDSEAYGPEIAAVLALDGKGYRLAPLAQGKCSSAEARAALGKIGRHLAGCEHPQAALAGLYLYFSCSEEAHGIAQDLPTKEGSFWHAILHRQEPDAWNSGYWFRQVGSHPVYPMLLESAREIASSHPEAPDLGLSNRWDPVRFIEYCEAARGLPGSPAEALALEIQRAEWQVLFDYCARRKS